MSCFLIESDGKVSLIVRFLKKNNEYQRIWLCIDTKIARELLNYAKEKLKTRLRSSRILAVLFYKVDMGNIYSSNSTCSDKPLNIKAKTKVSFLKNKTFVLYQNLFILCINKR